MARKEASASGHHAGNALQACIQGSRKPPPSPASRPGERVTSGIDVLGPARPSPQLARFPWHLHQRGTGFNLVVLHACKQETHTSPRGEASNLRSTVMDRWGGVLCSPRRSCPEGLWTPEGCDQHLRTQRRKSGQDSWRKSAHRRAWGRTRSERDAELSEDPAGGRRAPTAQSGAT